MTDATASQPAKLIPCDVCGVPVSTRTVPGQRFTYINVHQRWHAGEDKSRDAFRNRLKQLEEAERRTAVDLGRIRTDVNNIDIPEPPEAIEIADSDEWPDYEDDDDTADNQRSQYIDDEPYTAPQSREDDEDDPDAAPAPAGPSTGRTAFFSET